MHDHDPLAFNHDLARNRQRSERTVVISLHRLDRRQPPKLGECLLPVDVTRVKDEVDPMEDLQDARGQPIEKLGAVRIGNDADTSRPASRIRGGSLG
jgi:hypothetical protein